MTIPTATTNLVKFDLCKSTGRYSAYVNGTTAYYDTEKDYQEGLADLEALNGFDDLIWELDNSVCPLLRFAENKPYLEMSSHNGQIRMTTKGGYFGKHYFKCSPTKFFALIEIHLTK